MVAVDLGGLAPEQFAAVIAAKLAALDITAPGSAGSPAQDAGTPRPPGAVRAGEADLRRLGVHAAISVPGVSDEVPPQYVLRDTDAAWHGVRAWVAAAAERGGFVLLTGGSSVGKTRCAAEAVRSLLPDWWLVHPAAPGEVTVLAAAPPARVVVWLDELQRYLDDEHGLTGGMVRALLNAPGPVVIIGTLWPDRYAAYTTVPAPGGADPHAREREVLDLAAVIPISAKFSPAEQDRARAAAGRDRRLALALGAEGYGLTQTLAAAPQLVARWEGAREGSPYAWAVLTAALDAARLGARAPLSADLLSAAAPGYCTSAQQATAPDNWLEQGLAYATARLHGAAAALSPAGSGMGQVAGYTVADYLLQHASRERRTARVPASTWDALLIHTRDPADAVRLADSAMGRLLYRYAIPLYRYAADADAGDGDGDGDGDAASRLAGLLAERGDLDGLRARADAGDGDAASRLAGLLAERGDLDGAIQILRARADAGDGTPPGGWPGCWPSAATWTGCAPGPTQATGTPPVGWPGCWPSAATWTGPSRSCAPGPTPATGTPPVGWPACSRGAATWTGPSRSCAPGPTPATGPPPIRWPACSRGAATWTGPSRSCAPGPTATGPPPGGWPGCWPSAATWTGCAPGPTPATTPPPVSWSSAATWTGPSRSCVPGPTPATGTPPGGWPGC